MLLPAAASAAPLPPYGNDVYQLYPNSYYAFSALTGPGARAGTNLRLDNGVYNVVRDYSATPEEDTNVSQGYLGSPTSTDLAGRRGFSMEWASGAGSNATDLTFKRTTEVLGTTQADSILKTTLSVTNAGTTSHRVGVQTAVTDQVNEDPNPLFVPWGGQATLGSQHDAPPAYKQFDLIDNSANLARDYTAVVRSTWSTVRPDLGATTPDVFDQRGNAGSPEQVFGLAPSPSSDLSNGRSVSVWLWGPTSAGARTLAPGETASYTVAMVAEAPTDAPVNDVAPAITGTPAVGSQLGSTVGTWSVTTPFTQYTRQWQRCDASGQACAPIAGATGDDYTPTDDDAGRVVRLVVAADRGGSASADVTVPKPAATAVPEAPQAAAPVATTSPVASAVPTAAPTTVPAARKGGKVTVRFGSSNARLTPAARTALRRLAASTSGAKTIDCVGYTASATGKPGYRSALGLRRARAACAYLAARVPGAKVTTSTKAGAEPVSSNATRKSRAANRRVVATIS